MKKFIVVSLLIGLVFYATPAFAPTFSGDELVPYGDQYVIYTESAPMALQLDTDGNGDMYLGKAAMGSATSAAVWQIKFIDFTGDDLFITWADGDDLFDNEWDERTNLSYN